MSCNELEELNQLLNGVTAESLADSGTYNTQSGFSTLKHFNMNVLHAYAAFQGKTHAHR